jgi:hypothetical protein
MVSFAATLHRGKLRAGSALVQGCVGHVREAHRGVNVPVPLDRWIREHKCRHPALKPEQARSQ